jgi:hypothetical protein
MMTPEHRIARYRVLPYQYAKGKFVIYAPSTDGWKTLAGRAADDLNLRYVGRAGGYIASAAQVKKFESAVEGQAVPY